jgi:hypothetical protein
MGERPSRASASGTSNTGEQHRAAASSKEVMRVENLLEGAVRYGTGCGCLASS